MLFPIFLYGSEKCAQMMRKERFMVIYHGTFKVAPGKREEYIQKIRESGLIEAFWKQPGCIFYSVAASITDEDCVIVCDGWKDEASYQGHVDSQAVKDWHEIYDEYVIDNTPREYHFQES